jgi:cytochrome b involved in lipid metabolism
MFDITDLQNGHNHEKDLYVVINGRVHDVTRFLDQHPGGSDNLLRFANGKDATSAFFGSQHPKDTKKRLEQNTLLVT